MVTSDPNGRLCRVELRVKHGLRYTYIVGSNDPYVHQVRTQMHTIDCIEQDTHYLDAETRGLY